MLMSDWFTCMSEEALYYCSVYTINVWIIYLYVNVRLIYLYVWRSFVLAFCLYNVWVIFLFVGALPRGDEEANCKYQTDLPVCLKKLCIIVLSIQCIGYLPVCKCQTDLPVCLKKLCIIILSIQCMGYFFICRSIT